MVLAVAAAELPVCGAVGVADVVSPAGVTLAGDVVDAAGVTGVVAPGVGVPDEAVAFGVGDGDVGVGDDGVGVGVVGVGVGVVVLGVGVREGLGVTRGVVVLGAGVGVVGDGGGVVCVTVGVEVSDGDEVGDGNPEGM